MELSEITFVVGSLLAGMAGAVAIGLRFDINEWIRRRDEKLRYRIQRTCTHTILEMGLDGRGQASTACDMVGERQWQCCRCQLIMSANTMADQTKRWANDPVGWMKQEREVDRLAQKL